MPRKKSAPKKLPEVKHITLVCPVSNCRGKAFVQVVNVADGTVQEKIDVLARRKLEKALVTAHKEGEHGR